MLRRKGGDGVEAELLPRRAQRVADGKDPGVKDADDVSGVGLLNDLPLGGHELLGPGELDLLAALDVVDLPIRVKAPGDQPA